MVLRRRALLPAVRAAAWPGTGVAFAVPAKTGRTLIGDGCAPKACSPRSANRGELPGRFAERVLGPGLPGA